MPLEKGQTKTGGRQPGSPNRATSALREQLHQLVETTLADLPTQLATLDIGERIRLISTILPYVMPRLATVDINTTLEFSEPQGATLHVWSAENVREFDQWCQRQGLPSALG